MIPSAINKRTLSPPEAARLGGSFLVKPAVVLALTGRPQAALA
jgi:hypothetical protein